MALLLEQKPNQFHLHHKSVANSTRTHVQTRGNDFTIQDNHLKQPKRPVHPEYSELNWRLFSFANWNYESVQSSRRLATNGFFYTNQGDLVRCYHCSIGFKDFIKTDDPLFEHARHSPDCPVLSQLLDLPPPEKKSANKDETPAQLQAKTDIEKPCSKSNTNTEIKHKEYLSYAVRLSSFTYWPAYKPQTPQQLAEAGFYHTGRDDLVRCFTCDGGLKNWDPTDDPWIEHCKHFPQCSFVHQVKGEGYVTLVQHTYKVPTMPELAKLPKPYVTKPVQVLQHRQPAKLHLLQAEKTVKEQLLQMGFSETVVDRAIVGLLRVNDDISVEMVLEEIDRQEQVDRTKSYLSQENIELSDKEEEYGRLKYQYNCKTCRAVQSNVLFLPCQHHCCCYSCSRTIDTCPLCGEYAQQKIKTFS